MNNINEILDNLIIKINRMQEGHDTLFSFFESKGVENFYTKNTHHIQITVHKNINDLSQPTKWVNLNQLTDAGLSISYCTLDDKVKHCFIPMNNIAAILPLTD